MNDVKGFAYMYAYKADVVLEGENTTISVQVQASDPFMAKRMIERIYGKVRLWVTVPQQIS